VILNNSMHARIGLLMILSPFDFQTVIWGIGRLTV
jgi:hypothetical protein